MRQFLKKILLSVIPTRVKHIVASEVIGNDDVSLDNIFFSQEGEDIILSKLYYDKKDGFYVDIGAHHPTKLSNTYKYYLKGWCGINVDAMPGSMSLFHKKRTRDINLELGISEKSGKLPFYVFDNAALNTFDEITAKKHSENYGIPIKKVVEVETYSLESILEKYLPAGQAIDFMSIDVEGLDLKVLQSNNWHKYQPEVILIENIGGLLENIFDTEIHKYLKQKGYNLISKTFHTNIYQITHQKSTVS